MAAAKECGGRYRQFTSGHGAVLILKRNDIDCRTMRKLGYALLSLRVNLPHRIDGFECRPVNVQAGGGAARCVKGPHSVEFGFE
jgi:hypothetical protein